MIFYIWRKGSKDSKGFEGSKGSEGAEGSKGSEGGGITAFGGDEYIVSVTG